MLSINVTLTGDKKLIAQLQKMDSTFGNWTPELNTIGEYLKNFYSMGAFETEGGIFGARWAALNPKYELLKRIQYPGRGILVRSGTMQGAYKYTVDPKFVELVNETGYAKFHQSGTSKMPKRVLVKIDNRAKNDIVNIFKQGIIDRIAKL